jgi:hypothetical protein
MTQIPPRGTPEFEEYKKTVEEAHRKGARIQILRRWQTDWTPIDDPAFNSWDNSLYRIAPDQPQFTQAPEPSMTPTEQRIVKALDKVMVTISCLFNSSTSQYGVGPAFTEKIGNEACRLVAALVADLPLSSPSEAPSEQPSQRQRRAVLRLLWTAGSPSVIG